MPRDVVTTAMDDHPALASHLERALVEEKEQQIQGLLSAQDWADFEKRRGQIFGLTAAIGLCKQVRERLEA
jgi:hypothetical protein